METSTSSSNRAIRFHLVIVLFCLAPSAMCQQPSPSPTPPLRIVRFNGAMAPFVAAIAQAYGTTIGLEIDTAEPNPNLEIAVDDATIEDVLNAVVKFKPNYSWSKSVNAFALFPKERRNPLLDTVIARFQLSDVDHADAVNKLLSLPDVEARMIAARLYRVVATNQVETNAKRISLRLSNVTMRQVLDSIATDSGSRFWIFQRTGGKGEFLSVRASY
jgi:hypothetical protein